MDSRDQKWSDVSLAAYHQVFEEKHGFIPGLSVLDAIFNMGPEALAK